MRQKKQYRNSHTAVSMMPTTTATVIDILQSNHPHRVYKNKIPVKCSSTKNTELLQPNESVYKSNLIRQPSNALKRRP